MSNNTWFEGRSNENIVEYLQSMSNEAVEYMKNKKKESSITVFDIMEKRIVELKEWISQTNDIRSPHYDMKRQFIRQLGDITVETYEKMLDEFYKWKHEEQ